MKIEKENYIACFILHALGDTIGYKNSIWEFNYNIENYNDIRETIEIISEFIKLGGINNIDLSGWLVSDDTLINYEIGKFILDIKDKITEKNILKLKENISEMIEYQSENNIERGFGTTTIFAVNNWTDKMDERYTKYNETSGGNGCTMRTFPIGLRYYKDKDLDKLIDISITTSKLTHNSPIGFLGGLSSAYFVKLAINKVPIKKWGRLYVELLESDKIKKYIDINNDDMYFDYRSTIRVWKKFIDMYFDENNELKDIKLKNNILGRITLFLQLNDILYPNSKYNNVIGGTGPTSMIMAYSALLDSDDNWEKIVYYSMLHSGDSDTVGAITGGLYGILYGFKNVPSHLLKHLEMKDKLEEIGNIFYEKFFNM
jgi:ADP-ribosylarginine hydrolase